MKRLRVLSAAGGVLLTLGLWSAVPVQAATFDVPGNFPTIQAAINASANGDTVVVEPGTYLENIDFKGKLITVRSAQGPGVTTIDGGGVAPVVNFSTAETSAAVLEGFTLQHGNGTAPFGYEGGGVHINSASPTVVGNFITANNSCSGGSGISVAFASPTIRDNTITGNGKQPICSGNWGGGIYVRGAASTQIVHNTITNNTSDFGGGISLFAAGTPTLLNNTISGNNANYEGGGIDIANQSDATVVQNVISGNSAVNEGGGLYLLTPSGTRGPLFVNNTFASNAAPDSGVHLGGFDGQVQLSNNIVVGSAAQPAVLCDTTYSSTSPVFDHNDLFNSGGPAAAGSCVNFLANGANISADSRFAAEGDYHLTAGSPAIDAGNSSAPSLPATDLDGKPRISGAAVDQGVYELQQTPPFTITASSLPGTTEGASFSAVVANFSGGVAPYSASIGWGDGQTTPGVIGAGNSVSGTHAYAEEGGYGLTITVADSTGASVSAPTSITAADASISLTGTRLTVHHKNRFTAPVATLTDADPGGATADYSGQISWGDGSVSSCPSASCLLAAQSGGFSVTGTHSYSKSRTYTVTIQLTDTGGSTATTTTTIQAT
jgi:hypothetical protein